MDKFRPVLAILKSNQVTLEVGLVTLLTAAGEQIFSAVVFKCPCNSWNLSYGTVFLLVPALALLVLGLILSSKTWELFTGLCFRERTPCTVQCSCAHVKGLWQIFAFALVAPLSWIAVALLNGIFYECARTGFANVTLFFTNHPCSGKPQECVNELVKFPCSESTVTVPSSDRDDVLRIIHAEAQVIGWLLIASIIAAALLYTCVSRCSSPINHMQLKFLQVYAWKESDLLEKYTADHAQKLAERNLTSFFQQTPPDPIFTPEKQAWENVSSFFHFNEEKKHYSALQTYVETEL
ncbi:hypothetical protein GJAV_G00001910 [Gymnothorax javanicus]|nr:hypothetical protein GJAV_G00001910 [Gymnothorax javanicus]